MLRYLKDYANAITAVGYIFAAIGLFLAINGHVELGTAAMLWTWFLDHWDGHVARKTKDRRRPGAADFGKSFDGFGDFVHGILFPSIVIILLGKGSVLSFVAVAALIMAGAVRLSYFENVGLTADAKFIGVPVSYDAPLLALLLLARPMFSIERFQISLPIAFIILAALHVTTAIKVPSIRGRAIPFATVFAVAISAVLAVGGNDAKPL
ncbi:CDP-alcohol phosphatidyltransferase family protein [Rhizobium sp. 1AS11]|uniref:CDP-alcohol phosphatidyltransferase family protein n=1 Tax=Rhizobium acaciae TaxID=2989736 RepID=UPI0022214BC3|nr:CDP-alcohol phosphatidyltransferase family protein [Rhizobium acaciae]MCW1413000.1 CDP-alcohol phosphatidyltransferase family protein [Rhizobium acaciae]MCW1745152.1 CDP-alcohol phosphatidyltransferase family protein [Rhizobium acaciae]